MREKRAEDRLVSWSIERAFGMVSEHERVRRPQDLDGFTIPTPESEQYGQFAGPLRPTRNMEMVSCHGERSKVASPLGLDDTVTLRREKLQADVLEQGWRNIREAAA